MGPPPHRIGGKECIELTERIFDLAAVEARDQEAFIFVDNAARSQDPR
jgi:hypothetical protein